MPKCCQKEEPVEKSIHQEFNLVVQVPFIINSKFRKYPPYNMFSHWFLSYTSSLFPSRQCFLLNLVSLTYLIGCIMNLTSKLLYVARLLNLFFFFGKLLNNYSFHEDFKYINSMDIGVISYILLGRNLCVPAIQCLS